MPKKIGHLAFQVFQFYEAYFIGSTYGIFPYIYHKNQPNVGRYTIHGSYGYGIVMFVFCGVLGSGHVPSINGLAARMKPQRSHPRAAKEATENAETEKGWTEGGAFRLLGCPVGRKLGPTVKGSVGPIYTVYKYVYR